MGFPDGSEAKNLPANAGDLASITLLGRFPVEEIATHSSILALTRGAWWATVHGVAKRWTQLSMHTGN